MWKSWNFIKNCDHSKIAKKLVKIVIKSGTSRTPSSACRHHTIIQSMKNKWDSFTLIINFDFTYPNKSKMVSQTFFGVYFLRKLSRVLCCTTMRLDTHYKFSCDNIDLLHNVMTCRVRELKLTYERFYHH